MSFNAEYAASSWRHAISRNALVHIRIVALHCWYDNLVSDHIQLLFVRRHVLVLSPAVPLDLWLGLGVSVAFEGETGALLQRDRASGRRVHIINCGRH